MTTAVDALFSCGGEASTAELLARTTYRELQAALEAGSIARLRRGRYGLPGQPSARVAAHALDAVVSHLSAAEYWDLPVVNRPDIPQLTVPPNRKRRRAPLAQLYWANVPAADRSRRVTSPARTVIDCARTVPFAEALAIGDAAVHAGLVTPSRLQRFGSALRGPGSAAARRVMAAVDGRADSCLESVLRAILIEAGLEGFEPQFAIDEDGLRIRVDLGNPSTRLVLEADGFEFHGTRAAFVGDCWRYDELVARGWRVLRFSYEQVIGRPEWVLGVIVRTLNNGCLVGTDDERAR